MKQDYFEERLKNILEEGQEQPFDQDQWRQLDRRLREADRPATPLWLRWLPVAFLLLLGALVLQHFTLSRQIGALEATLLTDREVRTTVVYDTVYLRTSVEESESGITPSRNVSSSDPLTNNDASEGNTVMARRNYLLVGESLPAFSARPEAFNRPLAFAGTDRLGQSFSDYRQRQRFAEKNNNSAEALGYDVSAGVTDLPRGPWSLLKVNGLAFPTLPAPASSPYSYPKPSLLQRLKPKTYTLAVGGGGLKETAFPEDDDEWQAGIGLHLGFSNSIGLRIGADYLSRSFQLGEDDAERFTLPSAEPRYVDDELKSISGSPNLLQFPVGLRIKLIRVGKFSTFTEGGAVATLTTPSNLRYNFENEDEEEYYDVFVEDRLNSALRVNSWYGRLGIRYDWEHRWGLQLTATRQQGFGDFAYDYERPDFLYYRLATTLRW